MTKENSKSALRLIGLNALQYNHVLAPKTASKEIKKFSSFFFYWIVKEPMVRSQDKRDVVSLSGAVRWLAAEFYRICQQENMMV